MDKTLSHYTSQLPGAHAEQGGSPPESLLPVSDYQPGLARISLLNLMPDLGYR